MSRKLRNTTLGNVGFSLEQMLLKPVASQSGDFFQRTVLFEQMSCAGNNFDFMFGLKFSCGVSVQFNDDVIQFSHNQEGRRTNGGQRRSSQVGTAAARNNSLDDVRPGGGGDQSCRGASARAEITDVPHFQTGTGAEPVRAGNQPIGQ